MDETPHASEKQCTGPCGRTLDATPEYFHNKKTGKYGLHSQCKECTNARVKAWKEPRRKEISEKEKVYYQKNKDTINKKNKEYAQGRRDHLRAYLNRYYLAHREESRESRKEYSKWYKKTARGRMVDRAALHRRRAQKKAVGGTLTAEQIQAKLKAQKYRCYYAACGHSKLKKKDGKYIFHIEHTVPTSRTEEGPRHDINFVVLACPACNLSKHDKLPHEWPQGGRLF